MSDKKSSYVVKYLLYKYTAYKLQSVCKKRTTSHDFDGIIVTVEQIRHVAWI